MLSAEVLGAVRVVHLAAGVVWMGTIVFANLLIAPLVESMPPAEATRFVATALPRFLAFRHAAWVTVLAGFVLVYGLYWQRGDLVTSDAAKTVFAGMVVGVVMLALVWFAISPNLSAIVRAAQGGPPPPPNAGRDSTYASRAVFALSVPLLIFMVGSAHFPMDWPAIAAVLLLGSAAGFGTVYAVEIRGMHAGRRAREA